MMKGITPVVATILLLIIAVAVVGLAYGFITGFFSSVTGKAAIVSGSSSCSGGAVSIRITNAGTGNINDPATGASDILITRTSCTPTACSGTPTFGSAGTIAPGASGIKTETASTCGSGRTCNYDVAVGGVIFPTQATC